MMRFFATPPPPATPRQVAETELRRLVAMAGLVGVVVEGRSQDEIAMLRGLAAQVELARRAVEVLTK